MNKKIHYSTVLFMLMFEPLAYASLPASMDYVNQKIAEVTQKISSLRNELLSEINNISAGKQDPVGASGPKGDSGVMGPAGPKGDSGPMGLTGRQGPVGPQGARGLTGSPGIGIPEGGIKNQILVKNSEASFDTAWIDMKVIHHIGDHELGGVVFWVDATGAHGLVAPGADQQSTIAWYSNKWVVTNAHGNGIGAGKTNTTLIISQQTPPASDSTMAALACVNYAIQENGSSECNNANEGTCYADWYLPSAYELNLMYLAAKEIGGFSSANYWSSTEVSQTDAIQQNFSTGQQNNVSKIMNNSVRCIRAF